MMCAVIFTAAPCLVMIATRLWGFWAQWQPTREGYLQFLAESKRLFETLEDVVAEAPQPDCELLGGSSYASSPVDRSSCACQVSDCYRALVHVSRTLLCYKLQMPASRTQV